MEVVMGGTLAFEDAAVAESGCIGAALAGTPGRRR
jgi:hypothetical protein